MANILDKLFLPIRKIDTQNRIVYGVLAAEVPDRTNEILDYDGSKKAIEAWRDTAIKNTGGKSQGNLRVMHTDKVAGKFTDITFDDERKEVLCAAKVVDDAEWKLVEEGAYTGFSVGARVGKREKDVTNPKLTRWTIGTMVEGSLVDLPCIPTATFDVMKGDTLVEARQFKIHPQGTQTPYLFSVSDNFKSVLKTVFSSLDKIGSADRSIGVLRTIAQSAGIKKSLWDASDLCCVLMTVNRIRLNLTAEAQVEGDGSPIPEELRSWLDSGAKLLLDLISEEAAELTQDAPVLPVIEVDISNYSDNKIDAKKSDTNEVKKMADETVKVEETKKNEPSETKVEQPDVIKSLDVATKKFDEAVSTLGKKAEEQDIAIKNLTELVQTVVEVLKVTPLPVKSVSPQAIAVTKAQDGVDATKGIETPNDTRSAFKSALAFENGKSIFPR
jgi:hypothetical protein